MLDVQRESSVQICKSRLCFADKATNPSNSQEDWKYIMGFCERVEKEFEGCSHIVSINAF